MGLDPTKPFFGIFEKVRLKPVSSATETSFRYDTFQKVNNNGANQSAWMRRLVYVAGHFDSTPCCDQEKKSDKIPENAYHNITL